MSEYGLLVAAASGDEREVRGLLEAGSDPNDTHERVGNSALYNATYANHVPVIRTLLEFGADPNLRLNYRSPVDGREELGVVALMYALSADAAQILISAGADVNLADSMGSTPLIRATIRAKADVVRVLLEAGANTQIKMQSGQRASDVIDSRIAMYKSWDVGPNRALIDEKIARFECIRVMLTARDS